MERKPARAGRAETLRAECKLRAERPAADLQVRIVRAVLKDDRQGQPRRAGHPQQSYIPVRDQNAEAVQRERQERAKVDVNKLQASRMQAAAQAGQQDKQKPMPLHVEKKVGRNDPCPCGSGKKYKQCCGRK